MFSRCGRYLLTNSPRVLSCITASKSPASQQIRGLKLWVTAVSPKGLPGREILNYQKLELRPAESCMLQLLHPDSIEYKPVKELDHSSRLQTVPSVVENPSYEEISLQEVLDNRLQGKMCLARPLNQQNPKQYCLQLVEEQEVKPRKRPRKFGGDYPASDCKVLGFSPQNDWNIIQDRLEKARSWLNISLTVEISVAWSRKKDEIPKKEAMDELLDNNLHLRPDVIQALMPVKSMISIAPQTNWLRYAWVISPIRNKREKHWAPSLNNRFEQKQKDVATLNASGLYEGNILQVTTKEARKFIKGL